MHEYEKKFHICTVWVLHMKKQKISLCYLVLGYDNIKMWDDMRSIILCNPGTTRVICLRDPEKKTCIFETKHCYKSLKVEEK